jgi:polysaccharide biosynthesis transport protein
VTDTTTVDEMTLRDYAQVVWRRKWFVIIPTIATALVALVLVSLQTPMYRASADVLVRLPPTASSVGATGLVLSPRLVENEFETASGSALQSQVREVIGSEPSLSVSFREGSDVFTFTAESSDADLAAQAANAYASTYIASQTGSLVSEYDARAAVIQEQLSAIESGDVDPGRRAEYERELEDLQVSIELARTSSSRLIDEATPPSLPFEPNAMRTVTLALVVGLLIGLGAAFLVDYLDTTLKEEDDLQRASGLPNLAVVPWVHEWREGSLHVVTRENPNSASAEAYRHLRTSVRFLGLDRELRRVQVTSPRPGDGKTTTACNLAVAAARAGQKVVLIDCDLRKPQVHTYFGIPNDVGFTSVLLGESTLPAAAQAIAGEANLRVVTSGPLPPDPSELLSGDSARRVLTSVSDTVDLVVIDSPPVLPVSDPMVLASLVDGVVLVASASGTDARQVVKAVGRLHQVEAPLLGTVLNRFEGRSASDYSYGYERPLAPTVGDTASNEQPAHTTATPTADDLSLTGDDTSIATSAPAST